MPEAPRPGARATATPSRRKSALTLPRLLLAAAGLLLIAYFAGKRPSGPRPADPATTAARPAPTVHPTAPATARVIPGRKSTTLAQVGEAGMSASQDGRVLRIEGGVGRNFAADLQQQLERNPSLQRIEITSGGGYASTGLAAARLIRKRNLIVKVRAYCASVCVALWAAAAQRQMEPDAVIGLHQWNPQCEALPSPHREEAATRPSSPPSTRPATTAGCAAQASTGTCSTCRRPPRRKTLPSWTSCSSGTTASSSA